MDYPIGPQANGIFALMRFSSVTSTSVDLFRLRFLLEFFELIRWRAEAFLLRILPVPVTLKRFDTAFLVLLLAIGFGIGAGKLTDPQGMANLFLWRLGRRMGFPL